MTQSVLPPTKNAEKFVVRLPQGMRARIAETARRYRRSMNSEIVTRLERSLDGSPASDGEGAMLPGTRSLSELEIRLVNLFRRLPDAKRAAILELLS